MVSIADKRKKIALSEVLKLKIHGKTPLHIAVIQGNLDSIIKLLDNKADINATNKNGKKPLEYVSKRCTLEDIMHHAAKHGKFKVVKILLDNKADINAKDSSGQTMMHLAAIKGDSMVIKLLLDNKANMDAQDLQGQTPLHHAIMQNKLLVVKRPVAVPKYSSGQTALPPVTNEFKGSHSDIIKLLLDNNADINAQNNNKQTPLHLAVMKGAITVITALLAYRADTLIKIIKADINAQDHQGQTALHLAVMKGDIELIKMLLANNAFIDVQDHQGQTALHLAVMKGNFEVIQELLSHKGNVNVEDSVRKTPLDYVKDDDLVATTHYAIKANNSEAVEVLSIRLSYNQHSINSQDPLGRTLLHTAFMEGNFVAIRKLLYYKPNINLKDKEGLTPLKLAHEAGKLLTILYQAIENGNNTIMQILLDYQPDIINNKDSTKSTPLHYAASRSKFLPMVELLNRKADVNAKDRDERTPLHLAIEQGAFSDIISTLCIHEADVNAKDEFEKTPLHYAMLYRAYPEDVSTLCKHNADVNAKNTDGKTPLHYAGMNPKAIEILLNYNANINAQDYVGNTPLHIAVTEKNLDSIKTLLAKGANINVENEDGKTALDMAKDQLDIDHEITKILEAAEAVKAVEAVKAIEVAEATKAPEALEISFDNPDLASVAPVGCAEDCSTSHDA